MLPQTNKVPGKVDLPDPELKAIEAAEHQKRVNTHFERSVTRWKAMYYHEGVDETIYQQRRDLVLALVEKLRLPPESHILEIGCGGGSTAVALARRGYRVEAIDTVHAMIAATRELAVQSGVGQRLRTSVGNVYALAFPDNAFSAGVAIGVTPFLLALDRALQEMARVLRPEGYLIVSADNRWRLIHVLDPRRFPVLESTRWRVRDVLEQLALAKPELQRVRPRRYSVREFDALLSAAGLEKLEGTTLGFGSFSFFNHRLLSDSTGVKVHHKLQSLADRGFPLMRSAGAQYIVLAKKKAVVPVG